MAVSSISTRLHSRSWRIFNVHFFACFQQFSIEFRAFSILDFCAFPSSVFSCFYRWFPCIFIFALKKTLTNYRSCWCSMNFYFFQQNVRMCAIASFRKYTILSLLRNCTNGWKWCSFVYHRWCSISRSWSLMFARDYIYFCASSSFCNFRAFFISLIMMLFDNIFARFPCGLV